MLISRPQTSLSNWHPKVIPLIHQLNYPQTTSRQSIGLYLPFGEWLAWLPFKTYFLIELLSEKHAVLTSLQVSWTIAVAFMISNWWSASTICIQICILCLVFNWTVFMKSCRQFLYGLANKVRSSFLPLRTRQWLGEAVLAVLCPSGRRDKKSWWRTSLRFWMKPVG